MKKVLYITPHLSTGGQPQYLLKKIQLLKDVYNIYVVEYTLLSPRYIVQREQIIDLVGFYSPGDKKETILDYIEQIQPDIIHMEEIPELFMDDKITKKIYSQDRKYMIFETSHTVEFNPKNKRFYPDRFIFVSSYQVKQYKDIDIPKEVVEYPIEYKDEKRPNPFDGMMKACKHILVVGLFTPNKNQGYAFELARYLEQFLDDKIVFDFVGNYAPNFEDYWKPLFDDRPVNCFIHGEKDNVDDYYAHCDAVVFPSNIAECAPLVIREALSWKKPLFIFDMKYYEDKYRHTNNVYYLTGESNFDGTNIRRVLGLGLKPKIKLVHLLTDPETPREKESIEQLSELEQYGIEYVQHNNERYTKKPPVDRCLNPKAVTDTFGEARLSPAHYGCYLAHKYGILGEFTNDIDFLIVAEADCKIEVPLQEFVDMVYKVGSVMEKKDITHFSFGDKHNFDNNFLESPKIADLGVDFMYETNQIICVHCIMFKKQDRDYLISALQKEKWQVSDFWYNIIFQKDKKKFGILENRMATQIDGFSILDQKEKKYK
jgi:glycosyltransferase involved in cell wall biosynthesis